MFGFSLAAQLFQGSAQRTWNCVTQFTNLIWYKFNHIRHPIMPRSRRRHHSRSRSRSRSHSHDRDREPKRRKIDNLDSPNHKRSVSCEPDTSTMKTEISSKNKENRVTEIQTTGEIGSTDHQDETMNFKDTQEIETSEVVETSSDVAGDEDQNSEDSVDDDSQIDEDMVPSDKPVKQLEEKLKITPKKTMSPKQLQKKLESEQKRKQKQQEREEREKKRQEEKEKVRQEKLKQKLEKEEQKQKERMEKNEQKAKERELKRKEKEEKEQKRKEKEEREEQKRKEREEEKLKKQKELEEKNREKQKQEEQKQKAAAAFVNFFLAKKPETEEKKLEEGRTSIFMPFEIKSDMRLPPMRRHCMTEEEKDHLVKHLQEQDEQKSYLIELRQGKSVRRSGKTWPYEDNADDVVIIEEEFGESICEDKPKSQRMRSKFLKFHENRRPAYFGTWRKKSRAVGPRRPFVEDKLFFDYEVDSDDDWEEEEQGESLTGSDDEDKENEAENDDYEVDNEFFVPHGHLSEDEVDDEATAKLSPESHKQKLKLLKDEFDQDMQMKMHKIKPRSIGCIWYNKDGSNVDEAINRHLRPLAMITSGQILIRKRSEFIVQSHNKKHLKELNKELVPAFLKLIHGNVSKRKTVVEDFIIYMENNGFGIDTTKANLGRNLKQFAQWKKCPDEGPMLNKFCWYVHDDIKEKYNVDLTIQK